MFTHQHNFRKFTVLHIITGLTTGGAEQMLYKLLSQTNREQFDPIVISLMDRGTLGDRIADLGIPVYTLGMNQGQAKLGEIWRLMQFVRQLQPDLIQGWMYHANLAAQIVSNFTVQPVPVIWNIRHSLYSLDYEKPSTARVIKVLNSLSRFPTKIIYNSKISANQHQQVGYKVNKTVVIPNGFNTKLFVPSSDSRLKVRAELGLNNDTLLIGRISRFHAMKDFPNFLQAAAILLKKYPDIHFILAGSEVNWQNAALSNLIKNLGISEHVHLLGERQDIPQITSALDIAASSSLFGEAFPNVIGEAMSCAVPCVVTDVGDSAWIIGNTGRVVHPQNSLALASAWEEMINLGAWGRNALGEVARARVIANFSLDSVIAQYEALYVSVLQFQVVMAA